MSSVVAYEPYVVRVGRGDPFVQSGIYRMFVNRGLIFGPNFVVQKNTFSGGVSFVQ